MNCLPESHYWETRKMVLTYLTILVLCQKPCNAVSNVLDLGVNEVIQEALVKVRESNSIMETRFMTGIDKHVQDFSTVEPALFSDSPLDIRNIEYQCKILMWITQILRGRGLTLSSTEVLHHPTATVSNLSCPFTLPVACPVSPYRTLDGTCNNPTNPRLGSGFTPYSRDLYPVYEPDSSGFPDLPRTKSRDGSELPGARVVSTRFHSTNATINYDSNLTFIFSIWGQFIAHDITDRAPGKGFQQSTLDCCTQAIPTKACFNIDVPRNDIFQNTGRSCLSFARSAPVTDINCRSGRREQLNQASSFIDASSVYGQTDEKLKFLRKFFNGELIMSEPDHLPYKSHPNSLGEKQGFATMQSGDDRVTVFPGLIGMETVWFREHNSVARKLKALNPNWLDEQLFQEARRVVIAMIQHITYTEWLPLLLGNEIMIKYGLAVLQSGLSSAYDPSVDPSTANEVATAAFRFGHSLIRPEFNLVDRSYQIINGQTMLLQDSFFKPNLYLMHEQQFMRGTLVDSSKKMNRLISSPLVNKLYQTRQGNGIDLAALNLQRGRDHGLAPYNSWRRLYRLTEASEFTTNSTLGFPDIPLNSLQILQQLYNHPGDVDLWTGGVSETPLPGATVGPLFANMLGRQFRKYKYGDRFWYETAATPQAFTDDQLTEIRKMTFARILCDTLELDTIQPRAFQRHTASGNNRINCSQVPSIDLSSWTVTASSRTIV